MNFKHDRVYYIILESPRKMVVCQINGGGRLSGGKQGAVLAEGKVVSKSRDFTNKHVFGFPSHISVSAWRAGLHVP